MNSKNGNLNALEALFRRLEAKLQEVRSAVCPLKFYLLARQSPGMTGSYQSRGPGSGSGCRLVNC